MIARKSLRASSAARYGWKGRAQKNGASNPVSRVTRYTHRTFNLQGPCLCYQLEAPSLLIERRNPQLVPDPRGSVEQPRCRQIVLRALIDVASLRSGGSPQ